MGKNIVKKETEPVIPGIGVSGMVMCPYFKGPCLKSGCEFWVELTYDKTLVGRCAQSYMPIVTVELRQEIVRLMDLLKGANNASTKKGSVNPG